MDIVKMKSEIKFLYLKMETWRTCCMQQKIKRLFSTHYIYFILWLNWNICNWKWRSESVVFAPVWDRTVIKSQDQVGRKFAVPVLLGNPDVSCSGLQVSTVQSRISESKKQPINIFPIIFLGDQKHCPYIDLCAVVDCAWVEVWYMCRP